jgi:hypothetical protein
LCDIHYTTTYKNLGDYKKAIENNPAPAKKNKGWFVEQAIAFIIEGPTKPISIKVHK